MGFCAPQLQGGDSVCQNAERKVDAGGTEADYGDYALRKNGERIRPTLAKLSRRRCASEAELAITPQVASGTGLQK